MFIQKEEEYASPPLAGLHRKGHAPPPSAVPDTCRWGWRAGGRVARGPPIRAPHSPGGRPPRTSATVRRLCPLRRSIAHATPPPAVDYDLRHGCCAGRRGPGGRTGIAPLGGRPGLGAAAEARALRLSPSPPSSPSQPISCRRLRLRRLGRSGPEGSGQVMAGGRAARR